MMQEVSSRAVIVSMIVMVMCCGSCERDRDLAGGRSGLGPVAVELVEPARTRGGSPAQPIRIPVADIEPVRADPVPVIASSPRADPGAVFLIEAIGRAIGGRQLGGETEIAIRRLRNQSRAPGIELLEVRSRLLAQFAHAAPGRKVRFVEEPTDNTEYTLAGVAYLIERERVEYWEMYFALRPVDANWRIWKNAQPVRLLRHAGEGADAIVYVPES